jgi:hypothetical protein
VTKSTDLRYLETSKGQKTLTDLQGFRIHEKTTWLRSFEYHQGLAALRTQLMDVANEQAVEHREFTLNSSENRIQSSLMKSGNSDLIRSLFGNMIDIRRTHFTHLTNDISLGKKEKNRIVKDRMHN